MITRKVINKYARLCLKLLVGFCILIALLLTIASIYIHYRKADILSRIKTQLNSAVNGTVNIEDMDISLATTFPYAGINLNTVSILDTQYKKPLLYAREAACRINLFQLFSQHPKIAKIILHDGSFHLFTDSRGYSNASVFAKKNNAENNAGKNSSSSSASLIQGFELKNIKVSIEDSVKNKLYAFNCKELYADVSTDDSIITVKLEENIFVKGLGFNLKKGSYLVNQTLETNSWHIRINTENKDISFGKTRIRINDQSYYINAHFHLKDSAWFQLHAITTSVAYRQAAAILPAPVQKRLNMLGLSKPLNVEAHIVGPLAPNTDPHVFAKWITTDNEFSTPFIMFNNCTFSGYYNNQVFKSFSPGDRNSQIVLKDFTSSWGNIVLSTDHIWLQNLAKPVLKFNFKTQIDFQTLDEQLALESIQFTGGSAQVYLQYNGPLIASPVLFSGITSDIQLQNVSLRYQPRNITFTNCSGNVSISENSLTVSKLECNVKENHFVVNVAGNNLNRLALNDRGKSYISCDVFSPAVDLNDFRSIFTTNSNTAARRNTKSSFASVNGKIDDMLEKGDLLLNIQAKHLKLDHFDADNIKAKLLFSNNFWEIQNASLNHAGGSLDMKGRINEVSSSSHLAKAKVIMHNVDVKKVFYAFDNFGQTGITSANLRGIMDASADVSLGINNSGRLIKNTIDGIIHFSIRKGSLVNFTPLQSIQDIAFINRDLTNITFAELKDTLTIKNNEVYIHRMEIASSALHMFVEGVYGINRNTDISIQIPINNLKKQKDDYVPKNKGIDARTGMSIYLRAKTGEDGKIKISVESLFKRNRNK